MTRPFLSRAGLLLLGLAPVLITAGCAHTRKRAETQYVARDVSTLYNAAKQRLDQHSYAEAAAIFDEVERQHPYSPWARRAQLMSAFSYYGARSYTDAIQSAQRFLSIHPGNRDAPYAYYLIALCYYEQIGDVTRDQKITNQAKDALGELIRRYPVTRYAADARLKLDLVNDHLAGKEMEVGRFYQRRRQWIAAAMRFRRVIDLYQTTTHTPEALERLVESYLALGLQEEARRSAAVLGANFPGSEWYDRSYDLMRKYAPAVAAEAAVAPAPAPSVPAPQPVVMTRPAPTSQPASVPAPALQAASTQQTPGQSSASSTRQVAAASESAPVANSGRKTKPEKKKKEEPARCGKSGLFHRARCDTADTPS